VREMNTSTVSSKRFSINEIITILFAVFLFFSSLHVLISGIKIRYYLFDLDIAAKQPRVGSVTEIRGNLRRKGASSTNFDSIDQDDLLYNLDTLVTSQESGATLVFDDGSVLELGPGTMIKLEFGYGDIFGAITRSPVVSVVTGNVKGEAIKRNIVLKSDKKILTIDHKTARPALERTLQISPVEIQPIDVQPITVAALPVEKLSIPRAQEKRVIPRKVEKKGLRVVKVLPDPSRPVQFEYSEVVKGKRIDLLWKFNYPGAQVEVSVYQLEKLAESGTVSRVLVKSDVLTLKKKNLVLTHVFKKAGLYEWEIGTTDPLFEFPVKPKGQFRISSKISDRIVLKDPLVSGRKTASNEYDENRTGQLDLLLNWKQFKKIKNYQLKIFDPKRPEKPIEVESVKGLKTPLNPKYLEEGQLVYQVAAALPNGFEVYSKPGEFRFTFNPPDLKNPQNGAVLKLGRIIMTWEKTNFTTGYVVEISKNSNFEKLVGTQNTDENFAFVEGLNVGTYYWRVKSKNKKIESPPGKPHRFVISE